jgi:hypothetical protein
MTAPFKHTENREEACLVPAVPCAVQFGQQVSLVYQNTDTESLEEPGERKIHIRRLAELHYVYPAGKQRANGQQSGGGK